MRNVEGFEWDENAFMFNKDFIKSCNKDSNTRYIFEIDVQYPERSHKLCNDFPFFTTNKNEILKELKNFNASITL